MEGNDAFSTTPFGTATPTLSSSPTLSTPSTPWNPPLMPQVERVDSTGWYYGLASAVVVLVLLFVLAVLYRRGLIFRGAAWKRRPSHAQPWKHWGEGRSRMPSLFDLLHVPQRKKSSVNPGVSIPATETAFSMTTPVHLGDAASAATVRIQVEPDPAPSLSTLAVPPTPRSLEMPEPPEYGRHASPLPDYPTPGKSLGPIDE